LDSGGLTSQILRPVPLSLKSGSVKPPSPLPLPKSSPWKHSFGRQDGGEEREEA